MTRLLALVLIAALGVLTIGCESKKSTSENKTETKISQTKDGKTSETTITVDTEKTATPATPDGRGTMTEKRTETTTETTK